MATRTYITCRSTGTNLTGPIQGTWAAGDSDRDNRGSQTFVFLLADTATSGGVVTSATTSGAHTTKGANQKIPIGNQSEGQIRWATKPLASSGTLSGTVTITMKVVINSGTGSAGAYYVYAYISNGDSLTPRNVILANATGGTAWTSTLTWRSETFTLTSGAYQTGDRIVFEIGANSSCPTAPAGDNFYQVGFGTTNSSNVVQADATNGSTGAGAAWLEFSAALAWQADPASPTNTTCALATAISSLPYATAPIDTTQSSGSDRSVWFTWTAPNNDRTYCTVRGSNYWIHARGWQGSCSALSLIQLNTTGDTNSNPVPWLGSSQSMMWFDAVQGTQYWFQLDTNFVTVGGDAQYGAQQSGGSLQFQVFQGSDPQTDDLYVDCQYIVGYRGSTPIVWGNGFYSNTPTGNVIDTTRRSLDDLNGGTDTSIRLYVGLFGSTADVEILDLATLNNGEFEIDFIIDALGGSGAGQNIGSVIFNQAGDMIVGWYGDNYSVIGGVSSPDACAIRVINATHADNQTGAPWPLATKYTVDQDVGGTPFVELAFDQTTVFYTSSGTKILRYDLNSSTQLPVFATLPAATGPRPGARGLRLLPPGDGTGGLLVSYGNIVYRLDSAGAVVQSYVPSATARAQDMDKIELSSDAQVFWVSDQYSASVFSFNVQTGVQLSDLQTLLPNGQLCGFSVYGGYRAGQSPVPTPFPQPPGGVVVPPFDLSGNGIFDPLVMRRLRRSPHIDSERRRVFTNTIEFVFQPGTGSTVGLGSDPQVMFRKSRDGGMTYGNEQWKSAGKMGEFLRRVRYGRTGSGREQVLEIVVTDPNVPWVLLDAIFNPTVGTN